MAQVAMGDSAWTVVTDIDLSQIDKTIDQISDEIKRANKTQHPSGDTDSHSISNIESQQA